MCLKERNDSTTLQWFCTSLPLIVTFELLVCFFKHNHQTLQKTCKIVDEELVPSASDECGAIASQGIEITRVKNWVCAITQANYP